MVGKLMKHELRAILRVLMWFMIAVALLSALVRIFAELDANVDLNDSITLAIAQTTATTFWYLSLFALGFAGTIMCLVRYFRSLFTGEGYMTFSLPVSPTKLLVAKFLSALVVTVACFAEIAVCLFIALSGRETQYLLEDLSAFFETVGEFYRSYPSLAAEATVLAVVAIPSEIVYLFLVASIGQLFTKHRVGITFFLYYASAFLLGMLSSLLLTPYILTANVSPHLLLCLGIVFVTAFDVGGFFIIRYILTRKVNLVV